MEASPPTTPRRDKDPQFDFQTFLDQMKSRSADPIAKYLRSHVLSPLHHTTHQFPV